MVEFEGKLFLANRSRGGEYVRQYLFEKKEERTIHLPLSPTLIVRYSTLPPSMVAMFT
jgi:hypothetical protein